MRLCREHDRFLKRMYGPGHGEIDDDHFVEVLKYPAINQLSVTEKLNTWQISFLIPIPIFNQVHHFRPSLCYGHNIYAQRKVYLSNSKLPHMFSHALVPLAANINTLT